MGREQYDLVVVGGGVAGRHAAAAAASSGVQTLLLDERSSVLRSDDIGCHVRTDSIVWAVLPEGRVAVAAHDDTYDLTARAIVLATGAASITEPEPGWSQPDIRLALMAECAAGYAEDLGGWIPGRTRTTATSSPGIFVAGDGAGLCANEEIAAREGTIAGLAAAAFLGQAVDHQLDEAIAALEKLAPERMRIVDELDAWYVQSERVTPQPMVAYPWLTDGEGDEGSTTARSMVCPCEAIDAATISEAIRAGATTLNDVKRRTRAGMGVCQGVQCGRPIRAMICAETGITPDRVPPMTARPPARLLPLRAFAAGGAVGVREAADARHGN